MLQIFGFFWQMCLFRRGPEGLPSSNFATLWVFSIYLMIALAIVTLTRPDNSFAVITGTIAIGITLQAGVTWSLLQFKNLTSRFRATWTGLLGTNTIMLVILLPFNFILLESESVALNLFADSATWVCLFWWLAIAGYIYHRAVDISILQGACIAFLVELLGVYTAYLVFQV